MDLDEYLENMRKSFNKSYIADEMELINRMTETFGSDTEQGLSAMTMGLLDGLREKIKRNSFVIDPFKETLDENIRDSLQYILASNDYCNELLTMLSFVEMGCRGIERASRAYSEKLQEMSDGSSSGHDGGRD